MLTPPAAAGARSFRRNAAGASAVEFALVLPTMLALYAGLTEMAHAVSAWRQVTHLARTVADLTSQGDTVNPMTSSVMTDILASSAAVMNPFDSSKVKIVVSALGVDAQALLLNHPRVCSSQANANGQARGTGLASNLTIPPGFNVLGGRYMLAEVSVPYQPVFGASLVKLVNGLNGYVTLTTSFPWPTRGGSAYNSTTLEVVLPGGSPCPS